MSYHVCPKCGKHGDVEFSSSGERHAFVATCDKDDCPQTQGIKRFAKLFERTTDNAARQESPVSQSGAKDTPTTPAPAAPTPCPWTDAQHWVWNVEGEEGEKRAYVSVDFARRLEALVHQQQEAIVENDNLRALDARRRCSAAYAALQKEMERG